jgi:hypothetical protein
MFTAVQDFLLRLTPLRAFFLFSGCLLAGSMLIFIEWGKPVTPSLPVVAYGLVLFYCQTHLYVQFNATTKDSPYFLGFLLTLIALFQILSSDLGESIGREFMVREVGAAVLTTVCGLFMRQLLLSRDPSEEAHDRVLQTLAEEIRRDTVEFHRAQNSSSISSENSSRATRISLSGKRGRSRNMSSVCKTERTSSAIFNSGFRS